MLLFCGSVFVLFPSLLKFICIHLLELTDLKTFSYVQNVVDWVSLLVRGSFQNIHTPLYNCICFLTAHTHPHTACSLDSVLSHVRCCQSPSICLFLVFLSGRISFCSPRLFLFLPHLREVSVLEAHFLAVSNSFGNFRVLFSFP